MASWRLGAATWFLEVERGVEFCANEIVCRCARQTVGQTRSINLSIFLSILFSSIYQILFVCFTGMIINNCNGNK